MVCGVGRSPWCAATMSNTRCTQASCGSVQTGGMSLTMCISTSGPSARRRSSHRQAWSTPGTVRMSTPTSAKSGTEFRFCPPRIVPTFSVGRPITGCAGQPKSW